MNDNEQMKSKLYKRLEKQSNSEDETKRKDAELCIAVYNKLKEISGKVWESDWNVLVRTEFLGTYPYIRNYSLTHIGRYFIKGIDID